MGFDTNDKNLRLLKLDDGDLELLREEFMKVTRRHKIKVRSFQEAEGLKGLRGLNAKVCGN